MIYRSMIEKTLELEGGPSSHPWDKGGDTMYGLSARYNPLLANEIRTRTLSRSRAIAYIEQKYLDKFKTIKHDPVLFYVFDASFSGQRYANGVLQGLLNWLFVDMDEPLEIDGIVGEKTIHVINLLEDSVVPRLIRFLALSSDGVARAQANWTLFYSGVDLTNGFIRRQALRVEHMKEYVSEKVKTKP